MFIHHEIIYQKLYILTGEPYFATFYHNNFSMFETNFSHFFYLLGKNVFGFHWHERNLSVFVKMQKLQEIQKISGEIWSPGEILFFAL